MAGSDYTANFASNSRISNCAGNWEGDCDGDITGWDKTTKFIIALLAECNAHACDALTMTLYWSDVTDGSAYAALGASGEMKQGGGCSDPNASACQATSEDTFVQNGNQFAFAGRSRGQHIELRVIVCPADADPGHEYAFRLYDEADGTLVDVAGAATIKMEAPPSTPMYRGTLTLRRGMGPGGRIPHIKKNLKKLK